MSEALAVGLPRAFRLGDEAFALYGGRALHWPAIDALVIADLHLGKGEVFRRAGLPVPRGGTRDDLARLSALLAATGASRLIVLGDLLHGPLHSAAGWREDWQHFRGQHPGLRVELVPGNHDRALRPRAGASPSVHGVESADGLGETLREASPIERGLVLCHAPEDAPRGLPSLCGHLHPAVAVPGLGRLPAFWWRSRERQLVLPAFSGFTGRVRPRASRGDVFHACAGHAVLPVPA